MARQEVGAGMGSGSGSGSLGFLASCMSDNKLYVEMVKQQETRDVVSKESVNKKDSTGNLYHPPKDDDGELGGTTSGCYAANSQDRCREISNLQFRRESNGKNPLVQCSWCVRGEQTRCASCEAIHLQGTEGYYCNPGKSVCENGVVKSGVGGNPVKPPEDEAASALFPRDSIGNVRVPLTIKKFCRILDEKIGLKGGPVFMRKNVFPRYCSTLLGDVCADECRRLSALYSEVWETEGGLVYKLDWADCWKCLENDDCTPTCLGTVEGCGTSDQGDIDVKNKPYGHWCGAEMTGGKELTARRYLLEGSDPNFLGHCIDAIDCACREHDKACARPEGCCKSDDLKLYTAATKLPTKFWLKANWVGAFVKSYQETRCPPGKENCDGTCVTSSLQAPPLLAGQ
jgi:hypothetical protein